MAAKTNAKATKAEVATETKTFWLNEDQIDSLVNQAKSKGLDLDGAIEFISNAGYTVGDRQVYMKGFVASWHNSDTNKSIRSFF